MSDQTQGEEGETSALSIAGKAFPARKAPPIVGIGASAGGLDAFSQLLAHLPETTGMSFVLIQHLDPSHESHLCDLLGRVTGMPVAQVADGEEVLADRVYVIPPGVTLTLSGNSLKLAPRPNQRGLHLPIDIFFRSLAEQNRGGAIGIILSGTGSDGAQGLEEIRAAGGITFAQDPASAGYDSMPKAVIECGTADFILAPAEIAGELARIAGEDTHYLRIRDEAALPAEPDGFAGVLELVRARMGVDFAQYRDSTLKRRILRRMTLRHQASVSGYVRLLEGDPIEIAALYQDFLINVTRFFRDPEVFEALKATVFPEILKEKTPKTPIRIWVTGCSSGQEAYSLAILLLEFLADWPRPPPPYQIFASDLSEVRALEKARLGFYPESIEADVSPERLSRFFTKESRGYRIRKDIRSNCIFAKHDLVADPPFSRVDLVTCRNVLIYMSPALQRKVIPIFHYALNPGGFLLLGPSETVGRDSDLFAALDREHKIYSRKSNASRPTHFLARHPFSGAASAAPAGGDSAGHADFRREADRILLGRFAPASVLVNAELEILQFRGRTRPYLEPAQGEASLSLLKMANPSLYLDLRTAIEEARARNAAVEVKEARVQDGDRITIIRLEILPVSLPGSKESCFLVLFEADPVPESPGAEPSRVDEGMPSPPASDETTRLRKEAESLRTYLHSIMEKHEAAIEDLKSSNEEHLSGNEELQSTNEELETAKEEYQSANEELTTVNEEMSHRNLEMTRLNNDLNNLLNSIKVPIVIVGGDLRIRRFTQAAGLALHILPSDIGRSLRELQWDFPSPELGKAVSEVVADGLPQEHEVRNREGRWQSLRIHPYRTSDNGIDGAVVVLMDIDALKTFQDQLSEAEEYARSIVATVREPLLILREDLRINTANASFYLMFGNTQEESEGQPLFGAGKAGFNALGLKPLVEACLRKGEAFEGFEMTFSDKASAPRTLRLNGRPLLREKGKARMVLLSIADITEYKEAQDILKSQSTILERAVLERTAELQASTEGLEAFSYSISHDLRSPLRAMQGYAEALLKDFGREASEGAREYMRKIIQAGSRMDRLILDVLTYSRTALSGIRIGAVDLDALVREVIGQLPELAARETVLAVESPLIPVRGHEPSLAQCISNLLLNAVKFVPKGTVPRISLRTEACGACVRLWVEDNGIGIDPSQHERIFGMFEKLHPGESYSGTGIGLTIVKKSMERMGGSVGLESNPGRGTRFWLQLPGETAV